MRFSDFDHTGRPAFTAPNGNGILSPSDPGPHHQGPPAMEFSDSDHTGRPAFTAPSGNGAGPPAVRLLDFSHLGGLPTNERSVQAANQSWRAHEVACGTTSAAPHPGHHHQRMQPYASGMRESCEYAAALVDRLCCRAASSAERSSADVSIEAAGSEEPLLPGISESLAGSSDPLVGSSEQLSLEMLAHAGDDAPGDLGSASSLLAPSTSSVSGYRASEASVTEASRWMVGRVVSRAFAGLRRDRSA